MKTHFWLGSALLVLASSCTFDPTSSRQISIQLKVVDPPHTVPTRGLAPAGVGMMDCFFVNVTGTGIDRSPLGPDNGIPNSCLDLGIMSQPVSKENLLAGALRVRVKDAGTYRFRLIGASTGRTQGCTGLNDPNSLLAVPTLELYAIGSADAEVGTGNHTVNIVNSYTGGGATNLIACNTGPSVTTITPTAAIWRGGVPLTITGTGFAPNARVKIGDKDCLSTTTANATTITCTSPKSFPANGVDVAVSNPRTEYGVHSSLFSYRSFLYAGTYSQIESFSIDPVTGALSSLAAPASIGLPNPVDHLAITSDGKTIYTGIGSTSPMQVKHAALDSTSGTISAPSTYTAPAGSGGHKIFVHPSNSFLYVTDSGSTTGFMFQLSLSGGGVPSAIGAGFQAATSFPHSISGIGGYLFSGQQNGEIGRWSIAADGSLTRLTSHSIAGAGIFYFLMRHPTKNVIYFGDSSSDVYSAVVAADGTLTVSTAISLSANPQRGVVHTGANKLYVSMGGGSADIAKLTIAENGSLTLDSEFTISGAAKGFKDLVIDPAGNFMYAVDGGVTARVVRLNIDALGALTEGTNTSLAATPSLSLLLN